MTNWTQVLTNEIGQIFYPISGGRTGCSEPRPPGSPKQPRLGTAQHILCKHSLVLLHLVFLFFFLFFCGKKLKQLRRWTHVLLNQWHFPLVPLRCPACETACVSASLLLSLNIFIIASEKCVRGGVSSQWEPDASSSYWSDNGDRPACSL